MPETLVQHAGRLILITGVIITTIGVAVWGIGKLGFRGIPGDIFYKSDRVTFYFPLATCILLSILLTAFASLWRWFNRG